MVLIYKIDIHETVKPTKVQCQKVKVQGQIQQNNYKGYKFKSIMNFWILMIHIHTVKIKRAICYNHERYLHLLGVNAIFSLKLEIIFD